jgi:glycosyl transferase family 25
MKANELTTYCINLERRTEKWEQAQVEFDTFGLKPIRIDGVEHLDGHTGCTQAHLRALKHLKPPFLLAEDDIKFIGSIEQLQTAIDQLPPDWDMLYLGATLQNKLERYSDNLFRVKDAYTTHAIIYNSQRVIDFIVSEHNTRKVDVFLADVVQHKFNCFLCSPMIATQRAGFSDILGYETDYSGIEESYNKHTT